MHNSFFYLTCCEGGIQCNVNGTVCGGFGAYLTEEALQASGNTGLDVASDYCLSGGLYASSGKET